MELTVIIAIVIGVSLAFIFGFERLLPFMNVCSSLMPLALFYTSITIYTLITPLPFIEWDVVVTRSTFGPQYTIKVQDLPWATSLTTAINNPTIISILAMKVQVYEQGKFCAHPYTLNTFTEIGPQSLGFKPLLRVIATIQSWAIWISLVGIVVAMLEGAVKIVVSRKSLLDYTLVLVLLSVTMIVGLALAGPSTSIGQPPFILNTAKSCAGTIWLQANIQVIHWETLAGAIAGLIMQIGATGIMVKQWRDIWAQWKASKLVH